MEKIRVSADTLYKYLLEHNFVISVLSEKMGVSDGIVYNSFQHVPNRLGKPMRLSHANILKMNAALEQIASELRNSILRFGSEKQFTNQQGTTYDPGLIDSVKGGIARYFKLNGLTERVLGWNRYKCNFTFSMRNSPMYGKITRDDVDRINAEIIAVAGVFETFELVADEELAPKKEDKERSSETQIADGVPASETDYTLDDLYAAFGDGRKSAAARLRIALERKGISTLSEFVSLSPGQLLDMDGVGSGTIGLVYKALIRLGVRW